MLISTKLMNLFKEVHRQAFAEAVMTLPPNFAIRFIPELSRVSLFSGGFF